MTPTLINIFAFLLMGLVTFYVAPKYGINWFSIGYSVGYAMYCICLIFALRKHFKGFKWKNFLQNIAKMLLASTIMGVFIFFTRDLYSLINMPAKIFTCVEIMVAAAIYFTITFIIKSPEFSSVRVILKRIWPKNI